MKTWNSCKKITSFICRSATSSSFNTRSRKNYVALNSLWS